MRKPTTRRTKRDKQDADISFDPALLAKLRLAIGRLVGKPRASRDLMGQLLDVSPASIFNWENGTPPTRKYRRKVAELARDVEAGTVGLPAKWVRDEQTSSSAPSSEATALYANNVSVEFSESVAWLSFGVKRPGRTRAVDVCLLVVPPSVLTQLRRD